jgi:hypothetical protein
MKYTKLDITNRIVTRKDFVNQPRRLFVLADNLPDFRLPRHQLHLTQNRGGLAAAMRPNRIGGTQSHPIYDVNIVGVPTISFNSREKVTPQVIEESFAGIYRLLNCKDFDEVVVPCKDGVPAFGGGIAGKIDPVIKSKIDKEFDRLEKFINKKILLAKLPKIYQNAYQKGPLPLPDAKPSFMQNLLSQPYPRLSFLSNRIWNIVAIAITIKSLMVAGFILSTPLGSAIAIVTSMVAAVASSWLHGQLLKSFYGEEKQKFSIKGRKGWFLEKMEFHGNVMKLFGIDTPYKTTLSELENSINQQLTKQLSATDQEIKTFTKYYAKEIVNKNDFFSSEERNKVNSPEYAVEKDIKKYRAKS